MKNKQNIVKKGYTLKVVSWENDGDYYQTNYKTVDTKEEAKALYNLMQLCESKNNQKKEVIKLGNVTDSFSEEQIEVLENFFKENPILLKEPLEDKTSMDEDEWDDYILDLFYQAVDELLGSSEWFICRVMESCEVTYSPEDKIIEVEIVKF